MSSAATYVAVLAALMTGDPGRGALVFGCYGAVRGLTPLLGRPRPRPGAAALDARPPGALARTGRPAGSGRCSAVLLLAAVVGAL